MCRLHNKIVQHSSRPAQRHVIGSLETTPGVANHRALDRWRAVRGKPHEGLPQLALDPARKGPDSSVLAVRYGDVLEELIVWNKAKTTESAARVVLEMKRLSVPLSHGVTVDETRSSSRRARSGP